MPPFLSRPDTQYKASYLEALNEFHLEGRHLDEDYGQVRNNFERYVQVQRDRADVERIPQGWVPESYFWLIDNDEYIGTTRLRHHLTAGLRQYGGHIGYEIRPSKRMQGYGKEILRLALLEARKYGITRALVTCNRDNVGSRKIIEANGGVFEGEDSVWSGGYAIHERRYWIDIDEDA
jgi:predicted acetyltransferase